MSIGSASGSIPNSRRRWRYRSVFASGISTGFSEAYRAGSSICNMQDLGELVWPQNASAPLSESRASTSPSADRDRHPSVPFAIALLRDRGDEVHIGSLLYI